MFLSMEGSRRCRVTSDGRTLPVPGNGYALLTPQSRRGTWSGRPSTGAKVHALQCFFKGLLIDLAFVALHMVDIKIGACLPSAKELAVTCTGGALCLW